MNCIFKKNAWHNYNLIGGAILLALLCACTYSGVSSNQFVSFDDGHYIVDNQFVKRGLSFDTFLWAFSFLEKSGSYWHPFTWLSLMIDYHLFGLNPSWFHLVNLFFHSLSVILLFLAMNSMTNRVGSSLLIAGLFAIHPLNVESVAWAAERKTVLCGLFFMLSILFYEFYVRQPSPLRYLMICITFAFGLMAKSTIISLPIILLLLDIWPLRRYAGVAFNPQSASCCSLRWLIIEKIPLVTLSFFSVLATIFSLEAACILDERNLLPFGHKVANAVISYPLYLYKIILPLDLAVYYPVHLQLPTWQILVSSFVIFFFSVMAVRYLKSVPWFFLGWFWFLILLAPAIGLVRRGLWPAMADRFVYLPMIGFLILLVWGIDSLFDKYDVGAKIRCSCAVLIVSASAFLCHRQVAYWHDTGTLFQHAVKVTKNNDIALANLGWYRFSEGKDLEALSLFEQMAIIDPSKPDYEYARGALEFRNHNYMAATVWFKKALKRNEKHLASLYFLGLAYERSNMMDDAASAYIKLTDMNGLDPMQYRNKSAYRLRVIVQPLLTSNIIKQAEIALHSGNYESRRSYADALYRAGFWQLARSEYIKLLSDQLNYEFILHIADCDRRMENIVGAERTLKDLLKSYPLQCDVILMLGRIHTDRGDWGGALQVFETALKSGADCQNVKFARAFSYYAAGKWSEALAGFKDINTGNPELQNKTSRYIMQLEEF